MSIELTEHAESRHNILRAALELGDGIAAVRRSLERSGGIDSNSFEIKALEVRERTESARAAAAARPSA